MSQPYIAPQLILAGEADQVVLGGIIAGGDLSNEYIRPGGDLISDEGPDPTE